MAKNIQRKAVEQRMEMRMEQKLETHQEVMNRGIDWLTELAAGLGVGLVVVATKYAPGDEHWSRTSIQAPEGMDDDHFTMDAVRELSVSWSNAHHPDQMVWQDG